MHEDESTYNFTFRITPLEITKSNQTVTNKAIVIKLANKQAKFNNLHDTHQLTIPVLYSKTLNQYCPIKGITKIFDVNVDGTEMICCVGVFQTEDLLNSNKKQTLIERDVGPFLVKMRVSCRRTDGSFLKKITLEESQAPYIMDDSEELDDLSYCSQLSEEMKKSQMEVIGQQLVEERRKNRNLQQKLFQLRQQLKSLSGMNQYLKDKDAQMESIITTKESTIQGLKSLLKESNTQVQNQQKVINNLELTIQEMKEENSNLSETIENYRLKYGDLKAIKDKALERQIRDCLRWIDQQNREEELSLEDTVEPSVTSFLKSFEEIEHMPLEEMSIIRSQIVNILKRVDELIAHNSI